MSKFLSLFGSGDVRIGSPESFDRKAEGRAFAGILTHYREKPQLLMSVEPGDTGQAFRLMRIHTTAVQSCSSDHLRPSWYPKRTPESLFRENALQAGFSQAAVSMFLRQS